MKTNRIKDKTVLVHGVGNPEDSRLLVSLTQKSVRHGLDTKILAEDVALLITVLNEVPRLEVIKLRYRTSQFDLRGLRQRRVDRDNIHKTIDIERNVFGDSQVAGSMNSNGTLEGIVNRVALRIGARLATA